MIILTDASTRFILMYYYNEKGELRTWDSISERDIPSIYDDVDRAIQSWLDCEYTILHEEW